MKPSVVRLVVVLICFLVPIISAHPRQPPSTRDKLLTTASNVDPNYRALRDGNPVETLAINDMTFQRDAGTFLLRSGRISFLPPVVGKVAIGVFVGDGQFTLVPATPIETIYVQQTTGKEKFQESFDRMVLTFSDDTYEEISRRAKPDVGLDSKSGDVLREWRRRLRKASNEDIENAEAELLGNLEKEKNNAAFSAYLFGLDHRDLRFLIRPRGALPFLPASEEVALLNGAPGPGEASIWYLAHRESEYQNGSAHSNEDKRQIDVKHYRIETVFLDEELSAKATIQFQAVQSGERLLRLGLLPTLRVSSVTLGPGHNADFIQEREQEDGSLYVIFPDPLVAGQAYSLTVEYRGKKVLKDAGGGNFSVRARTSWYPSVNAFTDWATFDLTFKYPKKYTLVSVGKPLRQESEGEFAVSQWVSDIPLAVAGFNYGRFEKKTVSDEPTKYQLEGYMVREVPDEMQAQLIERFGHKLDINVTTRGMNNVLVEAQNSIRLFSQWFGPAPFTRLALTQQPQFGFAQSWPSLIFLTFENFLKEAESKDMGLTPHEVSHQWWGHMVGWASYHDQWLSEGFAEFSASLYLQLIDKNEREYQKFWSENRKRVLEKNLFGRRPNDAGPVWLGYRLSSEKNPNGYRNLVYAKGGYILHMLRYMMYDSKTADQRFIEMMQDFVRTYLYQNPTTEDFQSTVEKHLPPSLNLDGNGKMDWFFKEWVYGTEIPTYRFEYALTPQADGKVLLTGQLTQSGVSPTFKMAIPIYLDFDGQMVRLGMATATGSTTLPDLKVLLPKRPKHVLINAHNDILAVESISHEK